MPDKDWRVLVGDMIEHADLALDFIDDLDEATFLADIRTILAVTRCVEVIGEAARFVPEEVRLLAPEIPWARVVGARHILAHHYARVDAEILWKLVDGVLPQFVEQLNALLARPDAPP